MSQILKNHHYFHETTELKFLTKFGLKSSTFTLPKAFLEIHPNILKKAILVEPGHAKLFKILDVSNTNQTIRIFIRIPN